MKQAGRHVSMVPVKKILIANTVMEGIGWEEIFLSRKDITFFTAGTTDEILSIHREHKVDIIISDIDMPGTKLKKICQIMRAESALKGVAIIFISSDTGDVMKKYAACGPNAVFTKPVDHNKLLGKITELFNVAEREIMREIVKISVEVNLRNSFFFAVSGNISTSGMLIETDKVLSKGDSITCAFVLQHKVAVRGEIIRVNKKSSDTYCYGVKFRDIDQRTRKQIENFINKQDRVLSKTG